MNDFVIDFLFEHGIYYHGSIEQMKFEKKLEKYFKREYQKHITTPTDPQSYGISSSEGPLTSSIISDALSPYNHDPSIYSNFLDTEYMAYSMAYYGDTKTAVKHSQASLEEAQRCKYELISLRLGVQDNQKILDIGCGFGGYIKYLNKHYSNLRIVGVNPSKTQASHVARNMRDSTNFKLLECTIEEALIQLNGESFDSVVSIGVLEHISNYKLLQDKIYSILNKGGKCLHHMIVSENTVPQLLNPSKTLISKYFPDGRIWPYDELSKQSEQYTSYKRWFINGYNYWKTLDEWHYRYWQSLPHDLSKIDTLEVEYWNNYFMICKAMFAPYDGEFYGNGQYLFIK